MKKNSRKKVGILCGSFNPIHHGHLHLAIELKEKAHLDTILFLLTPTSPFKATKEDIASVQDRKEMLRLALVGFPSKEILIEDEKQSPNYLIDTLKQFDREQKEYFLILGSDLVVDLDHWKEIQQVLQLAPPLIGSRTTHPIQIPESLQHLEPLFSKNSYKVPLLEISSTVIRERLKKKLYCNHLVPPKVLDYIYSHQLYCFA